MRPSADMSKNLARTSCKKPNWHSAHVNHHFLTTTVGYIANCPVEWFTGACKIPTTSHILGQQLAPSVRSMVLSPHAYHASVAMHLAVAFWKRTQVVVVSPVWLTASPMSEIRHILFASAAQWMNKRITVY